MGFYSEEATSVIVLLISFMIIVLSNFSPLLTIVVTASSILVFLYLISVRRNYLEEPEDTMIGFIPGHYLLLFAFVLNSPSHLLVTGVWALLIAATLGYDFVTNRDGKMVPSKLTTMFLYCIIWCIIIFLFQRLLITGLELADFAALMTRLGFTISGLIWIGIGLIRINRSYT
ncbi:MAG: hypothetical protein ABEJ25_05905 [Candidatus Bipolaricaulia bacterium]